MIPNSFDSSQQIRRVESVASSMAFHSGLDFYEVLAKVCWEIPEPSTISS